MTLPTYDWQLRDALEEIPEEELQTIIVYLSERIDALEARITELESNRFLTANEVIFGNADEEFDNPELDEDEIIWEDRPKESHLCW